MPESHRGTRSYLKQLVLHVLFTILLYCRKADAAAPEVVPRPIPPPPPQVINGHLVHDDWAEKYPFVARITVKSSRGSGQMLCTGIFISRHIVYTAAHCFFDEDDNCEIAEKCQDISHPIPPQPSDSVKVYASDSSKPHMVSLVAIHPGFEPNKELRKQKDREYSASTDLMARFNYSHGDIAVLRLAGTGLERKPCEVLTSRECSEISPSDKFNILALVAGFGLIQEETPTDSLHAAWLPTTFNAQAEIGRSDVSTLWSNSDKTVIQYIGSGDSGSGFVLPVDSIDRGFLLPEEDVWTNERHAVLAAWMVRHVAMSHVQLRSTDQHVMQTQDTQNFEGYIAAKERGDADDEEHFVQKEVERRLRAKMDANDSDRPKLLQACGIANDSSATCKVVLLGINIETRHLITRERGQGWEEAVVTAESQSITSVHNHNVKQWLEEMRTIMKTKVGVTLRLPPLCGNMEVEVMPGDPASVAMKLVEKKWNVPVEKQIMVVKGLKVKPEATDWYIRGEVQIILLVLNACSKIGGVA